MAEAAREQTLTRLLEGTGLAISRLRAGLGTPPRSPARNEIRVVGSDQIVRVHRHNEDDVAAESNAPASVAAPATRDNDSGTIPTLHAVVSADEGWKDAGFFNVRLQRHADGRQSRVVVRHIGVSGLSDSSESARWSGADLEAAVEWMRTRIQPAAVPEAAPGPRHTPCALAISQAYAYQDLEEIDPRPLDPDRVNAGVPLAANTPLTFAIALTLHDPQAADDRQAKRCRVAVYAKAFPTGEQSEIGVQELDVNAAMDSWVARVPIKGLAAGKYRMTIVATLGAPHGGIAHREIPLVRVS